MLEACGDGRATVHDLDGVIDAARRKTAAHGVADRCGFRPGDFHTVPVEGSAYDVVVLGHVCRTEGHDGARHLVERAYGALRPEGRVVLADYFIGPMSPAGGGPDAFIAEFGQRPVIHLGELGVLGADTATTHCVRVDDSELDVMAAAGCSVEHCPTTALKVSYGVTQAAGKAVTARSGLSDKAKLPVL